MKTAQKMKFVPGLGAFGVPVREDAEVYWLKPTHEYLHACEAARLAHLGEAHPLVKGLRSLRKKLADRSRTGDARKSMRAQERRQLLAIKRAAYKSGLRLPGAF